MKFTKVIIFTVTMISMLSIDLCLTKDRIKFTRESEEGIIDTLKNITKKIIPKSRVSEEGIVDSFKNLTNKIFKSREAEEGIFDNWSLKNITNAAVNGVKRAYEATKGAIESAKNKLTKKQ
jgi:hypothetical protein